jgi:raffinose/stachyose/melibiose transport system substrate-binding protein
MSLRISAALAALMAASLATPGFAEVTVNVLRAETSDAEKALNEGMATAFESAHPGVDVKFEYLANEAYKQKLPTLLQSDARPDIFYSWGGGVLAEQAAAGFLADITPQMTGDWAASLSPAGVSAFTVDGVVHGAPTNASDVVFWTNKKRAAQAGIDPTAIHTWAEFLDAVKKAQAAGVTPIVVGGKDKWPLHFYYAYLAVREAGSAGFAQALAGEGDGFAAPAFVKAGQDFKTLVDLGAFQPGFMDTTFEQASGMFGDGKAVFHLMGDWDYDTSKSGSASGKGIDDADLAIVRFPAVDGGAGAGTDTFGGINGWAVARGASPEAVDFLKFMTSKDNQAAAAAQGLFIPVAVGAEAGLKNPFFAQIAASLAASTYHQVFLDQALGADVGATFNDLSADLAQGNKTPEEAAAALQEAWANR